MKAIILAAGYGNRMRPLTDNKHKTLLEIGGNTIISNLIDCLLNKDVRDVVVVVGYREDELKQYLLSKYSKRVNFQFVRNERFRETNNIFSLALAFEAIECDQDILVIESDLIVSQTILNRVIDSSYPNVALVDKYRQGMDGTVVKIKDDVVVEVIPPHLQDENFKFSDKFKTLNIYKFSQKFCETKFKKLLSFYSKIIDDNCYYELILGILIYMQNEVIHAEVVDGEVWAEVDDPNDMRIAEFTFQKNRRKNILESGFGGYWNYNIVDFCFIRNMYFPTPAMLSEMKNNLVSLVHNYGSKNSLVDAKMAIALLCNADNLIALNGAAQIYPFLRYHLKGIGLIPNPTFGEYYKIFGEFSEYSDAEAFSEKSFFDKVKKSDFVVFVNPNNPSGHLIPSQKIFDLAVEYPGKLIIVDESFIEFSAKQSILDMLEKNPLNNVIVIKSLSKSYGFPGIRLGACYTANKDFAGALRKWLPVWNFNSIAENALEIMLKHRNGFKKSIERTIEDRELFSAHLMSLNCVSKVYPSSANFILFKVTPEIDLVQLLLDDYDLYIKDVSEKFKDGNYFRVAVRTQQENEKLVEAIAEVSAR